MKWRTTGLFVFLLATRPAAAGEIEVTDAWARATPPGAMNGAAYVALTNRGDAPDRLMGASGDIAGMIQLHDHVHEGGVLKMRPIDAVELPPGATVTLEPGGKHIMLMHLHQGLAPEQSFALTLEFETSAPATIDVTVRR